MPRINQEVPINLSRPFTLLNGTTWDVSKDLVSYYRPTYMTDGMLRDETGRGNDLYLRPGQLKPNISSDNPESNIIANRVANSLVFKSDVTNNLVDYAESSKELPDHVMRRSDGTGDVPFSISAWFKLNNTTAASVIFEKYAAGKRELDFFVNSSNQINFRLGTGTNESVFKSIRSNSGIIVDGAWHHVVITYDGVRANSSTVSFAMYVDGAPVAETDGKPKTMRGL